MLVAVSSNQEQLRQNLSLSFLPSNNSSSSRYSSIQFALTFIFTRNTRDPLTQNVGCSFHSHSLSSHTSSSRSRSRSCSTRNRAAHIHGIIIHDPDIVTRREKREEREYRRLPRHSNTQFAFLSQSFFPPLIIHTHTLSLLFSSLTLCSNNSNCSPSSCPHLTAHSRTFRYLTYSFDPQTVHTSVFRFSKLFLFLFTASLPSSYFLLHQRESEQERENDDRSHSDLPLFNSFSASSHLLMVLFFLALSSFACVSLLNSPKGFFEPCYSE